MNINAKIYIAGHRGLVGSAITRTLKQNGYTNLITRTSAELDLRDPNAVARFFETEQPEYVFLAAAKVGGIIANNTYRGEFLYDNLMIQNNVIHEAYRNSVRKLLFLGSTCIYPRDCPQPMKEDYLLTAPLEYTNEPYAIAKIAGLKLCESYNLQYGTNFISVMPTNLYGPNDNFDLEKSHVLPALLRKLHLGKALSENNWDVVREDLNKRPVKGVDGNAPEEAILQVLSEFGISQVPLPKEAEIGNEPLDARYPTPNASVEIWGSGKPLREFLWSEDMADACVYIMEKVDFQNIVDMLGKEKEVRNVHLNIGTGKEISIKELAETIAQKIGYEGQLYFNTDMPDGTPRKLTDSTNLNRLGWQYSVELGEGIERMYEWYVGD